MYSFGGRCKYYFDFEIADEITPDLIITEDYVKSKPHYDRKTVKKSENRKNSEINLEKGCSKEKSNLI